MKNWVIFSISGTGLNPREISGILGMEPDKIHEMEWEGKISWQLISKLNAKQPLKDHLEDVLKRLYPVRKQIQNLSQNYEIHFYCGLEPDGERFLEIPPRFLTIIGSLGASLVIYF